VHLLAVMDHTTRAVVGQTDVDTTSNEITQFRPLADRLDLAATVVTADAMHTQREHSDWLVTHKLAAYLLVVKGNQPALYQQLKTLPWPDIPVSDQTHDRGHHRVEIRPLQVTTVTGLGFPHATQAVRITRRVRPLDGRRWRTVTTFAEDASQVRIGNASRAMASLRKSRHRHPAWPRPPQHRRRAAPQRP
jgi:predicted transposase YbfD/YdcC